MLPKMLETSLSLMMSADTDGFCWRYARLKSSVPQHFTRRRFSPRHARYGTFVVLGLLAGSSQGLSASAADAVVPRTASAATPTTALRSRFEMDKLLSPMWLEPH